ncbi:MAG: hypothetical protein ACPGXY_02470 [Alphaproteobacteria bacterium]
MKIIMMLVAVLVAGKLQATEVDCLAQQSDGEDACATKSPTKRKTVLTPKKGVSEGEVLSHVGNAKRKLFGGAETHELIVEVPVDYSRDFEKGLKEKNFRFVGRNSEKDLVFSARYHPPKKVMDIKLVIYRHDGCGIKILSKDRGLPCARVSSVEEVQPHAIALYRKLIPETLVSGTISQRASITYKYCNTTSTTHFFDICLSGQFDLEECQWLGPDFLPKHLSPMWGFINGRIQSGEFMGPDPLGDYHSGVKSPKKTAKWVFINNG